MKVIVRISRTMTGSFDYSAPNCFKNFSELALTLAGGLLSIKKYDNTKVA